MHKFDSCNSPYLRTFFSSKQGFPDSVYPFLFQQNLNFGFGSMHALDMLLFCLLLTIISLNFAKSFDVSANKFERISNLMFVSQT